MAETFKDQQNAPFDFRFAECFLGICFARLAQVVHATVLNFIADFGNEKYPRLLTAVREE